MISLNNSCMNNLNKKQHSIETHPNAPTDAYAILATEAQMRGLQKL